MKKRVPYVRKDVRQSYYLCHLVRLEAHCSRERSTEAAFWVLQPDLGREAFHQAGRQTQSYLRDLVWHQAQFRLRNHQITYFNKYQSPTPPAPAFTLQRISVHTKECFVPSQHTGRSFVTGNLDIL